MDKNRHDLAGFGLLAAGHGADIQKAVTAQRLSGTRHGPEARKEEG